MDFEKCSTKSNNKIIPISENKRKFTIINDSQRLVNKIKVDGCLINDHRERCDYLFEIDCPCVEAIYVELKGTDIQKAYNQLMATLVALSTRHNKLKKECYIVASKVTPYMNAIQQSLKVKMKKQHQATLLISSRLAEKNI